MLEGMFSESERLCREAIEVARAVGPAARGEEGHAICTLGISRAWGEDPEAGVALLREARQIAQELGHLLDGILPPDQRGRVHRQRARPPRARPHRGGRPGRAAANCSLSSIARSSCSSWRSSPGVRK